MEEVLQLQAEEVAAEEYRCDIVPAACTRHCGRHYPLRINNNSYSTGLSPRW